jgi:hypothetical protein
MCCRHFFSATESEPLELTERILVGVDKEKDDVMMVPVKESTKSKFAIIHVICLFM